MVSSSQRVTSERAQAMAVLSANTVAFTVCFAVWMLYGVLITYLVNQRVCAFTPSQVGWLIGLPVLTGALTRLPVGLLADRFGGRPVMLAILLWVAAMTWLSSYADTFWGFALGGLGFGVAGASFAAGVAYTSLWFSAHQQGTALGVFGIGNVGAAITTLLAPRLLHALTDGGLAPDSWRLLPRVYAVAVVVTAAAYWMVTFPRKPAEEAKRSLRERLSSLGTLRVWRFGLHYFLLFGGFVALAQWLVPYYVNVYLTSVVTAGALASLFSFPSALFRFLGGWLSDRLGARRVMYWVLSSSLALLVLLFPPRVELQAPGAGVAALQGGTVTEIAGGQIVVSGERYALQHIEEYSGQIRFGIHRDDEHFLLLPTASFRQVPVVRVGERIATGQLLARGVTLIYFQANRTIFTVLVFMLGVVLGLGSGAVFKHIATYFPGRVGVVGGIVSMLGAMGGFVYPILFGSLLGTTGIWTTAWMLLALVTVICLVWMHAVVRRLMTAAAPGVVRDVEERRSV